MPVPRTHALLLGEAAAPQADPEPEAPAPLGGPVLRLRLLQGQPPVAAREYDQARRVQHDPLLNIILETLIS